MCPPITLCCFFSSEFELTRKNFFFTFFQMLISHWPIKLWLISPPYPSRLLNSFPKWYDTWKSDENWAFYGQKTEEWYFCQKFCQNFRGLFGALKLEIFLKKGIFGWPWIGTIEFWGQKRNWKNCPSPYKSLSLLRWVINVFPLGVCWTLPPPALNRVKGRVQKYIPHPLTMP